MDDWPLKSIEECSLDEPYATQIGPFGSALSSKAYQPTGTPLLRGVNVNGGRFHDDDFVFISDEDTDRLAKYESFPGDVLLVHKGTLGQIGLMPSDRRFDRYIMGQSMLRVRCDPDVLLPEYLYYWLCSDEGQHYLFSRVSQVGVPQIQRPLTTLRQATLPVPPVEEQRVIASVLGSLDDKIELNRRMNRTLEQMAAAIFKAWFVDFEPVRAKASGAASFPGMPQPAFDALPATFADSELGVIPEGWEVMPFSDCVTIWSGGTPKRSEPSYWGGDVPWYSVKDAPVESDAWIIDTSEKITQAGLVGSAAKLLPVGTTIISARGTVGTLALSAVPMAMNQSCYGLEGVDGAGAYLTYWRTRRAVDVLRQRSHGSVFDTITRNTFEGVPIVTTNTVVLAAFDAVVSGLMELMQQNGVESRTLAETRDALLPKLLSGEVRVGVPLAEVTS